MCACCLGRAVNFLINNVDCEVLKVHICSFLNILTLNMLINCQRIRQSIIHIVCHLIHLKLERRDISSQIIIHRIWIKIRVEMHDIFTFGEKIERIFRIDPLEFLEFN